MSRHWFACLLVVLSACGDGNGAFNGDSGGGSGAPSAPTALTGNAGDTAVSLAWTAPASGTAPFTYAVAISPAASGAATTIAGTAAVVRGLANDTAYTFSVKASNSAGESTAATVQVTPAAVAATNTFAPIAVANDGGAPSGIRDASLLRQTGSEVWMAYSSVRTALNGNVLVRDVSTSLARSTDSGATFTFVRTLGAAAAGTVTDGDPGRGICGATTCSGRWVYETPFLIDDSGDSNSARRYKLFAHKYFLLPGRAGGDRLYAVGAMVMWTAPALSGTWSAETPVLGWNRTPAELLPVASNVNAFSGTSDCLGLREGGTALNGNSIDFVFACPFGTGTDPVQKIVLLRTTDHAQSFQFVSTPLQPEDANSFGSALYFSAPSLVPAGGNAQALLVTPVISRGINGAVATANYSGCVVIPFADVSAGTLVRDASDEPLPIASLPSPLTPVLANRQYGACTWDRGISATGIVMNDLRVPAQPEQAQFQMLASKKSL